MLGTQTLGANSFHHQAVAGLGSGLHAVAWAPDGTIEAIEGDGERFVLGVQWHAETLDQPEGPHVRLFEALVPRQSSGSTSPPDVWLRRPGGRADREVLEAPDEDVSRAFAAEWFSRAGAGTPVDRALRLDTEVMLVEDTVIDRPKGYFPVRRDAVEAMLSDPNADRTNLDGSSLWQLGPLEL